MLPHSSFYTTADCDPSTWAGCPNLAEVEQDAHDATAATSSSSSTSSSEHHAGAAAALSTEKAVDAAAHILSGLAHAGYSKHAYGAQAAALRAQARGRDAKQQALAALAAIPTKRGARSAVVQFLKRRAEMSPLDLHRTSGGASSIGASSPGNVAAALLKDHTNEVVEGTAVKAAVGAFLKHGGSGTTGDDAAAADDDDDADMCSDVAVRVKCGSDSTTMSQCYTSGCCWDYTSDPGVPSCFVSSAVPGADYQNSGWSFQNSGWFNFCVFF